jgi:hypothetical protein
MKHNRATDAQSSRSPSRRHGQQGPGRVRVRKAIAGSVALLAVARGVGRCPVRMGLFALSESLLGFSLKSVPPL